MNSKTVFSNTRKLLRDATHAEHVRLNQHPLLVGITKPGYPLAMYRQVLTAYFHFYRQLEMAIDQALASGLSRFSYEARRKLPWIISDLQYFGMDPEAAECLPLKPLAPIILADEGALLGALYTIEGSSLGGQVITRHLAENLGLSPQTGARFFFAYGDETMPLWLAFEQFINATLIGDVPRASAAKAARETFALMEAVLDDYRDR